MSIGKQKWMLQNKKADFEGIGKALSIDPVTVRLLRNRGLTTQEEMNDFLNADERKLHSPFLMKDMTKGIELIRKAIDAGEKIRVIGDYDADGITASYILYRTLVHLGADVSIAIPHRVKDGYGLNLNLIKQSKEDVIQTIITCDNGVSANEALLLAREYKITTVVTDHHRMPGTEQPDGNFIEDVVEADAVINPKQQGCEYPYKGLCGAGVAYKFSCGLLEVMTGEKWSVLSPLKKELLIYAAIGTVGDVMDLTEENRIIVKCGLNYLKTTEDNSLVMLIEKCGLQKDRIKSGNIGFQIAPCLNASGRIDSPQHALDLLTHKDREYCEMQAERLVLMNEERKAMTEQYVELATGIAEGTKDKVLVIYLPECHESIAGIVAGRIRERFLKPTLVITRGEEMCKGSGRSIDAYEMFEELSKVKDVFDKFGGHSMAVGFSIGENRINELRERINAFCALQEADLEEKVLIDVPMPMEYVTMDLLREFQRLEPFGKSNPTPLFAQKELTLLYVQVLGKERKFLRLIIETPSGMKTEGVYFVAPETFRDYMQQMHGEEVASNYMNGKRGNTKISVCYQPEIHTYMDKQNIRFQIKGIL